MARILQIRRGTTVQNDNFTGMAGELSFDTDTKTLRVHDGEKLGGYTLARVPDPATIADNFNIADVPDSFWTALFERFATAQGGTGLTIQESELTPILPNPVFTYTMARQITAQFVQIVLICQSDDAGYRAGDVCTAFGVGTNGMPMTNTYTDNEGLHITVFSGNGNYWVPNKTTAAHTDIDTSKWRIKLRVYC